MFLQCLMGSASLILHGSFFLCRQSLWSILLLPWGIVNLFSWGLCIMGADSQQCSQLEAEEPREKSTLCSDTIDHNCHKGFSHSKHFGLSGSLVWRQYWNYPFKVDIFCKVLPFKSQVFKENVFLEIFYLERQCISTSESLRLSKCLTWKE